MDIMVREEVMGTEYYAVCRERQEIYELGKSQMFQSLDVNRIEWVIACGSHIEIVNDACGDMIPYHDYILVGSVYDNQQHRIGKAFHVLK